jgi:hypothetical protein
VFISFLRIVKELLFVVARIVIEDDRTLCGHTQSAKITFGKSAKDISISPFVPGPHGILSAVDMCNYLAISHAMKPTAPPTHTHAKNRDDGECIMYCLYRQCSGAVTDSNVKIFYDLGLIMYIPR